MFKFSQEELDQKARDLFRDAVDQFKAETHELFYIGGTMSSKELNSENIEKTCQWIQEFESPTLTVWHTFDQYKLPVRCGISQDLKSTLEKFTWFPHEKYYNVSIFTRRSDLGSARRYKQRLKKIIKTPWRKKIQI